MKKLGRRRWKKEAGYHRQAQVENAFFRYKSIIGSGLRARSPGGRGDNVGIAYATSAVAVDRMMDLRGGASGLVILLQDLGRGVPFETAFHRRMGLWYDEFVQMARRLK